MFELISRRAGKAKYFVLTIVSTAMAFIFIFAWTAETLAQDGNSSQQPKKGSKRTTINFEDQLIEGRTQKPELFVLLQNRMNNSRRLFKLRENFIPEMRKTSEDVGRAESNVRGNAEPSK